MAQGEAPEQMGTGSLQAEMEGHQHRDKDFKARLLERRSTAQDSAFWDLGPMEEEDTHLLCSFVCKQSKLHGQALERLLQGAPCAEVQSSPGGQRGGVGTQSTAGTEHTLTCLSLH